MQKFVHGTARAVAFALILTLVSADASRAQEGAGGDKKPKSRLKEMPGQESLILETDHFYIEAYESLGQAGLEAFGKKAEQAYALAGEVLDQPADKRLWPDKCVVLMIKTTEHWQKYVDNTQEDKDRARVVKAASGIRTNEPGCVECLEQLGGNQQSLEQGALHQIGHHLLDNWSGKSTHPLPVWLDEGFASFIESSVCGKPGASCIGGRTSGEGEEPGHADWIDGAAWKAKILEDVKSELDKKPGSSFTWEAIRRCRDYNSMLRSQHAKSWSLVTFLVGLDKKKFQSFVKTLKSAVEVSPESIQDKAIDDAYKLNFNELESDWRKFIRQLPK